MLYRPIENYLYIIRGREVLLDYDLAALFGIPTKQLNQKVRRHPRRFTKEFVFRLTPDETTVLRSLEDGVSLRLRNLRYPPFAFTVAGICMLAAISRSDYSIRLTKLKCQNKSR